MRRVIAACTLAFASLVVVPSRADAYFWDWLDDLSGPSFHGITVELRIWCSFEDARNNLEYLSSLQRSVTGARTKFQERIRNDQPGGKKLEYLNDAVTMATRALEHVNDAIDVLGTNPQADASAFVIAALGSHAFAEERFEDALRTPLRDTVRPLPNPVIIDKARIATLGGGVTASLCLASPFARQSQYLSLDITWGFDIQKKGEPQYENRMVSFGASYHAVIKPYLTVGVGAGMATFSSNVTQPVQKFYVQPYIIDFKPLALRRNSQLRGPWWHLLYFRYNTITYPTGFALGSFAGQTEQFPAELIHAYGFYVDVEPILRDWMGKW